MVDVEDRDDSVWHNLTAYDGGLSGWRLLWDRWCPIPALRYVPHFEKLASKVRSALTVERCCVECLQFRLPTF